MEICILFFRVKGGENQSAHRNIANKSGQVQQTTEWLPCDWKVGHSETIKQKNRNKPRVCYGAHPQSCDMHTQEG